MFCSESAAETPVTTPPAEINGHIEADKNENKEEQHAEEKENEAEAENEKLNGNDEAEPNETAAPNQSMAIDTENVEIDENKATTNEQSVESETNVEIIEHAMEENTMVDAFPASPDETQKVCMFHSTMNFVWIVFIFVVWNFQPFFAVSIDWSYFIRIEFVERFFFSFYLFRSFTLSRRLICFSCVMHLYFLLLDIRYKTKFLSIQIRDDVVF